MGRLFHLSLILLACTFPIATSRRSRKRSSSDINWWCDRTPHPEPCKYYMGPSPGLRPKHKSQFRGMLVQLTMDQAQHMQAQTQGYAQNGETEKEKAVYGDCLTLYDNTILQLNRTYQGLMAKPKRRRCSVMDAQTWLSAALTNIATCKNGAVDLNLTSSHFAASDSGSVYFNVTKMISNGLAVNAAFLKRNNYRSEKNYTEKSESGSGSGSEFPRWFSRRERKLVTVSSATIKAHLVVAKDGSGDFRTVQGALNAAAKRRSKTRFVIRVKRGVYRENIEVDKSNDNIMLVGEGMRYTIITSSKSVQDGITTYSSATAGIDGLYFIARDIAFQNTAGPRKGQAVALRSASDLSVFYRCAIIGYQDTLMVHAQRQFYKECYIYGTVDFIFGNAAVVFQSCMIYARRPLAGQANMITAQGRGDPYQTTGISIHNCQILAAPDLQPVIGSFVTYLGRPWQEYSRVVVMKSYIDSLVSPLGWSPWGNSDYALTSLYFGEYGNLGPRSSTSTRVKWKGFHAITSSSEASSFTVNSLLAGSTWLPSTGVPFTAGL